MKKKKRNVVTDKKRFITFLSILLILLCCGFSSIKNYAAHSHAVQTISVYVVPGDTIWKIASDNNPYNRDIRMLVHEIKKCNNLSSSTIHVGDRLLIPVS